jgi:hypothetical protein
VSLLSTILRDGPQIIELGERDRERPVPSCPGWNVRNLSIHIQETCRDTLAEIGLTPTQPGFAGSLEALEASGIDANDPRLQGFAEECALHLWDARDAFGEAIPVDEEIALVGVDGFFEMAAPGVLKYRGIRAGSGETMHLHRTDGEGEWFVVLDELPILTHEHRKGDVAIRGPVSDLFLCLWGRVEPPEVLGDIEVFRRLREATRH